MAFGWLGTAGAGTAGAGAGGGLFGLGLGYTLPIMAIYTLLDQLGIFGRKSEEEEELERFYEAQRMKQQLKAIGYPEPYTSPFTPAIDEATFAAIMNQLKRTSNWGWPAGMEMETSWIEDLLKRYSPISTGTVRPGVKIRR